MWKLLSSILFVSIILGAVVAGFSYYGPGMTPCQRTLAYGLGDFDTRFGISEDDLLQTLLQAEAIWEKPLNLDLFAYSDNAELKINLIYDERQEQTTVEHKFREKIDSSGASYGSLVKEHTNILEKYQTARAEFQTRLTAHNAEVQNWNARETAPQGEEFEKMEDERRYLQKEQSRLNSVADRLNTLAERIRELAQKHNISVTEYNQKFSDAREFDQADYHRKEKEINIYQFSGMDELRLALAHEFGHALGLDHVDDPEAVMYYLLEKQDEAAPELVQADIRALNGQCRRSAP